MTDSLAQASSVDAACGLLRDELAHGDAMIASIAPILRHLLASEAHSVFADEIIARVRGMMTHIAGQLFEALPQAERHDDHRAVSQARTAELVDVLTSHTGLLGHVHALALEWQLTERLQARLALDPVLSPLLQALIASSDAEVASSGMALLAAQARFAQSQQRMQLPLAELPGDLLHAAVLAMRGLAGTDEAAQSAAAEAEKTIRDAYDEGRSRLGLIARLITGMGGGAAAALFVNHAGVAMFLSALALASGQDRDMAVLTTNDAQLARLALALRAAGLKTRSIEEQFVSLHPDAPLPAGLEQLGTDQAAALLARSAAYPRS